MSIPYVFIVIGVIIVIILITANLKVVPETYCYVIQRLGTFRTVWKAGLHCKTPFFDEIVNKVLLKEQVLDFPPQPVITKDNVTMQIDTVVYYQITDAFAYTYNIADPIVAIANLTATTLRNIIGELELDQTLTSRDVVNNKLRVLLDEATDPWGIKVKRVELKNIIPPAEIQDSMEKQMKAERERREAILRAEGEKRSAVLIAEGKKESAILTAEAEKEAAILRAEADKESAIRRGEGEAMALLKVQNALAQSVQMLKKAEPTNEIIALKSLDALEKLADGQATKIIVPSEIQSLAALNAGLKAISDKK